MFVRSLAVTCVLAATLGSARAAAQDTVRTRPSGDAPAAILLDVPFVPQSEALCGGAAAAMVMRYWGATGVSAEDFAPLVDDSAEGIRVGQLVRALTDRRWRAAAMSSNATDVRSDLARGRPIIALIEDRPGRNHYVVIVAWTDDRVVLHDPAYGAFRVADRAKFERAWSATANTTLLVLPLGAANSSISTAPGEAASPALPDACAAPVAEAVRLARSGDLSDAEVLLLLAGQQCPRSTAWKRELAGLHFLQEQWSEAERLAREVVTDDPSDVHAWQLVASSRFLEGDEVGALRAWNRVGEPRVDLVNIQGLDHTRYDVVAHLVNLGVEDVLTERKLLRARRRIDALPGVHASRVGYTPRAGGRATIEVGVAERARVAHGWPALIATGIHAGAAREVRLDLANAMGSGEVLTGAWRWWAGRPRVAIGLTWPRLWRASGLWRIEAGWEQQRYLAAPTAATSAHANALTTSEHRHAAVSFSDWASGDLRWEFRTGIDRWADRGTHVSAGGSVEHRSHGDRIAVGVNGTLFQALSATGNTFRSGGVFAAWRSSADSAPTWSLRVGTDAVSVGTPLDIWLAADTGHAGSALLRAHPLLHDGAIREADLSPILSYGTLEFQRPLTVTPWASLGWAVFTDVVKRGASTDGSRHATMVDAGIGLRIGLPATRQGLRIDVARSLRGRGGMALSAGWQTTWGAPDSAGQRR
jgi:hypothetical protein